jgi:hypothetical protein
MSIQGEETPMSATSWWRRIIGKPAESAKPSCRPKVELLEDRLAPANIYVQSFADGASVPLTNLGGGNFNAANLRSAVDRFTDLAGNSTIFLKTGTYEITGGEMAVDYDANTTAVKIINQTATGISTIDANDLSRIFVNNGGGFPPRTLTLERLKLTHGLAPNDQPSFGFESQGGAIFNYGALVINNCQFIDNAARGRDVLVSSTEVSALVGELTATSAYGGAIYNVSGAPLTIRNSTFDGNTATGGDGFGSTEFSGDAADGWGGAIYVPYSSGIVTISGSTFSNNSAVGGTYYEGSFGGGTPGDAYGGAIAFEGFYDDLFAASTETLHRIYNSTFASNHALGGDVESFGIESAGDEGPSAELVYGYAGDGYGGALFCGSQTTIGLLNDTIAFNEAAEGEALTAVGEVSEPYGGGIYSEEFASVEIGNTIVAKNVNDDDVFGEFDSLGHNFIGNADGAVGSPFTEPGDQAGNISDLLDPRFHPAGLASNGGPTKTIALLAHSTAINTGDNAVTVAGSSMLSALEISPLTTDQRGPGFGRRVIATVDIGAYEFQMNLNKFYSFRSNNSRPTTLIVPPLGLLLGSQAYPLPTPLFYKVALEGSPPGFGTSLTVNADGSFRFTVPPRFVRTVSFLFRVLVDTSEGVEPTNLVFTATIRVLPGGGRGAAGNFLGLGGFLP